MLQVAVAGADLLDGRQAAEHARVPHAPQAGGGAPPPGAAHAPDQPRVQAAPGLQVRHLTMPHCAINL